LQEPVDVQDKHPIGQGLHSQTPVEFTLIVPAGQASTQAKL